MRVIFYALLAALPVLVPAVIQAQQQIQTPFRPPVAFTDELPAPPIPADVTDDRRVARNYPEQPPVIPHNIRDYQLNLNTNRCLTCHSRKFTEVVQAPMISITHYIDRDGRRVGPAGARPGRQAVRRGARQRQAGAAAARRAGAAHGGRQA